MLMFLLSLILFVGGIFLFGVAFMVPSFHAVVFAAGIIAVCLAMALPMMDSQRMKH
ncbi:hypothetical protein [Microbacterium indicum]|uniref:hypothetical protein n=1 Tax=Microbacterium indicum TaxID=358100 RepID=UPI0003F4FC37|nr:hypothetical protein [Microbacterium indicum]